MASGPPFPPGPRAFPAGHGHTPVLSLAMLTRAVSGPCWPWVCCPGKAARAGVVMWEEAPSQGHAAVQPPQPPPCPDTQWWTLVLQSSCSRPPSHPATAPAGAAHRSVCSMGMAAHRLWPSSVGLCCAAVERRRL